MNHRPVATIFLAAALTALVGWRVHTTTSHVLPWPELTITTQETAAPGYDRSCRPGRGCVFGPDWHDDNTAAWGHDGCDQLNQLRARDLTAPTFKSARSCKVTGGTLTQDPYIAADRNVPWTDTSGDHVIPLHVAWDRGAHTWPLERRRAFANDPDNLILTTRRTNSSKGDQTPATWHPETQLGPCRYATAWVTTAGRYNIPVTPLENQRIHTMLQDC